ncbi:hypothetical protein FQN57_007488 [Myotisia sp. PD_48]|nr:hypothetical protein FQN57_007488 [Myotisia sp. PD_48]
MLRSLFRSRKHVRIRNLQKMYAEDVFQSCNSQEPPLKVVDWGLATPSKPFCYIFAPDPLADSDPHSQSNRNELTAMVEASLRLHNRIAHSDSNFGPGAVQHICAVKFENLGV